MHFIPVYLTDPLQQKSERVPYYASISAIALATCNIEDRFLVFVFETQKVSHLHFSQIACSNMFQIVHSDH